MKQSLLIIAAIVFLSGCQWVRLTSDGMTVRQATASEVVNCGRIGSTRSHTLSRLAIVDRNMDKLQEELLILARNEAANMGGNVIVPESEISEGQQSFGVYSCP